MRKLYLTFSRISPFVKILKKQLTKAYEDPTISSKKKELTDYLFAFIKTKNLEKAALLDGADLSETNIC